MLLTLLACEHPAVHSVTKSSQDDDLPSFTSESRWSDADDWEPAIAADPREPYVYQATTRIGAEMAQVVVRISDDAGETYGDDVVLSDDLDAYDPQLAVAADTGCVYFAWLGGESGWTTYTKSSCDHGATWSDAVSIAGLDWTTDHGWLITSPDGQDVYVAFNATPPTEPDSMGQGYVAVSHDGGASYEDIHVEGDGIERYWFENGAAMAPDGTLYIANENYLQDYTGSANLVLWRSADQGATWDSTTVATSEEAADCEWAEGCEEGFFSAQASVAVDADGTVMFVYSANTVAGEPMTLYAAFSPGAGAWDQFGAPTIISKNTGEDNFPTTKAGPTAGDFRVAWQGNTEGDPKTWNTWFQTTTDGGTSWLDAPIQLSDLGDGAAYKRDVGYAFPYGDYFQLSVDGEGENHVIWAEGASWTGPGGTWWTHGQ